MAHAVFLLFGCGQWVSIMHTVTVGIRLEISSLCSRGSASLVMSGWVYKCPGPCMDNNVTLPLPIPGVLDDAGVALGPDPTP